MLHALCSNDDGETIETRLNSQKILLDSLTEVKLHATFIQHLSQDIFTHFTTDAGDTFWPKCFGQLDNTPNQTIAELGMRLKKFKSVNRRGTKKHSWIASPCHNSPILIVYYIAIGAGIMTRWNYKKHCWSSFERACLNCSSWCMHTDYSSNMAYPLLKCSRYAVV